MCWYAVNEIPSLLHNCVLEKCVWHRKSPPSNMANGRKCFPTPGHYYVETRYAGNETRGNEQNFQFQ